MQNDSNTYLIQPVLAWKAFSNASTYTASNWVVWVTSSACDASGEQYYYSTPFNVSPGDPLYLYIWGGNCTNQGSCNTWIIETCDTNVTPSCTYLQLNNFTFRMERVYGGVLEFPGTTSCDNPSASSYTCSDFPGGHGHSATFSNIQIDYGFLSSPTYYYVDSNPTWISNYTSYPSNLSGCAPSGHTPFYTTGSGSTVNIYW